MVLELVLGGHMENTPLAPGTVALIARLIFRILSVKKDANSLEAPDVHRLLAQEGLLACQQ